VSCEHVHDRPPRRLRHRRLAAVLWLSLLGSALIASGPIKAFLAILDQGAFRETLVKGWDGWAFLSFLWNRQAEVAIAGAAISAAFLVFALLQIFLTGGVLRALIAGRNRPVFRIVVAESAGLFKANLWATFRFAITAGIWFAILVTVPAKSSARSSSRTPRPTRSVRTSRSGGA
jgi:hypothetical protein